MALETSTTLHQRRESQRGGLPSTAAASQRMNVSGSPYRARPKRGPIRVYTHQPQRWFYALWAISSALMSLLFMGLADVTRLTCVRGEDARVSCRAEASSLFAGSSVVVDASAATGAVTYVGLWPGEPHAVDLHLTTASVPIVLYHNQDTPQVYAAQQAIDAFLRHPAQPRVEAVIDRRLDGLIVALLAAGVQALMLLGFMNWTRITVDEDERRVTVAHRKSLWKTEAISLRQDEIRDVILMPDLTTTANAYRLALVCVSGERVPLAGTQLVDHAASENERRKLEDFLELSDEVATREPRARVESAL